MGVNAQGNSKCAVEINGAEKLRLRKIRETIRISSDCIYECGDNPVAPVEIPGNTKVWDVN